jgi:hypothetical protein
MPDIQKFNNRRLQSDSPAIGLAMIDSILSQEKNIPLSDLGTPAHLSHQPSNPNDKTIENEPTYEKEIREESLEYPQE